MFGAVIEHREHPRIQLPLLVELKHVSIGTVKTIARDISGTGVFVRLDNPKLPEGAKVQLTLLHVSNVETSATPTVQMAVQRVEPNGVGLRFVNTSYQHIWQSVERLRDDLAVGRDYFQVYQSAVVVNGRGAVLLALEHGKWLFPGHYLTVGDDWRVALQSHLELLGVSGVRIERCLDVRTGGEAVVPEAAVMALYHEVYGEADDPEHGPYRDVRWFDKAMEVETLTFHDEQLRRLARNALRIEDSSE